MNTRVLTNKAEILAYLESDRDYAAYAIGDLDDGFFEQCVWHVAQENGAIRALALVYAGFDPPVLFLMGSSNGAAALLGGPVQPEHAMPMVRAEHLAALGQYYRWGANDLVEMWRMALAIPRFSPVSFSLLSPLCLRQLEAQDAGRLFALYALGGGDAFTLAQLAQGVFYGVEIEGQLVAAAGTHLVSAAYSVAAVGNVMTHPDYRGRGYATAATSAVCAELARRGLASIVLNVGQHNAPAARVYEKLGFVKHCAFYEGHLERAPQR